jgi:hypothetical protein
VHYPDQVRLRQQNLPATPDQSAAFSGAEPKNSLFRSFHFKLKIPKLKVLLVRMVPPKLFVGRDLAADSFLENLKRFR